MRESKKQLIELLEPYMPKNLSEGCLIEFEWEVIRVCNSHTNELGDTYIDFWWREIRYKKQFVQILWHYDITAVLKYIEDKYTIEIDEFNFTVIDYYNSNNRCDECDNAYDWKILWKFPNKPLHLYSEEEEQFLLKLLKDLWKKN